MRNLIRLITWEYLIQNRINNLSKYLLISSLFFVFSTCLMNDQANIKQFGVIFFIIFFPIMLINFSQIIFKQDLEDGNLELLLSSFTEYHIVVAKFLTIFLISLICILCSIPIIYVIFNLNISIIIYIFFTLALLLMFASSLLVLIGAVQSYFRSSNNLLSSLIMPLLIPNIILTGLIIHDFEQKQLIFIMLGINLLFIPIILLFASYLIKNIYNV